jgi:hypothetical protein
MYLCTGGSDTCDLETPGDMLSKQVKWHGGTFGQCIDSGVQAKYVRRRTRVLIPADASKVVHTLPLFGRNHTQLLSI